MKNRYFYLALLQSIVFVFTFSSLALASISVLKEQKLLGCNQDSIIDTEYESYVFSKIDSMTLVERGEKIIEYRGLESSHSFTETPCIKHFIYIGPYHNDIISLEYGYRYILFNTCDSTIYHFNGNSSSFSRVFRAYLKQNFNREFIINLLSIFINTLHDFDSYYIIDSVKDYENIFADDKEFNGEKTFPPERLAPSKRIVEKTIKPIKFIKLNDAFEIEFYSWRWRYHEIDFWRFRVTKDSVILLERKLVAENVNPWNNTY